MNLENSRKYRKINQRGITLVALIITIIVLLILAMASISLVMNGGIIDKSKYATDKYSEEEIGEQLKLVYSEYQMSQLLGETRTAEQFITARLQEIFGNDNVSNVSLANNKLKATIKNKKYQYNINTGKAGELEGIKYGEKTKETIEKWEDITIGTERFKVISKSDGEIKALAYKPIELKTNNPLQSSSAGQIAFSSENYWNSTGTDIPMNEKNSNGSYKNNIQQYIDAYKETLEDEGAENFELRCPTNSDLGGYNPGYNSSRGLINGYWVATSHFDWESNVLCTSGTSSSMYYCSRTYSSEAYICPLLVINI